MNQQSVTVNRQVGIPIQQNPLALNSGQDFYMMPQIVQQHPQYQYMGPGFMPIMKTGY